MKNSKSQDVLLWHLLELLGVDNLKPTMEALSELVAAYVMKVPFENVSKLFYKKRYGRRSLPDLKTYVEGIERYHFGGTCYSNNYYLHLLLAHLGYDVKLCGADMANPDVHLVNIVSLDGREFIVDAGYAAPFLKPLPLDLKEDYVVTLGYDQYRLHPKDKYGNSHLQFDRDGRSKHGYTVKPIPRQIEHFARVIEDSFRDSATFMNALLLARFYPNRSVAIHNLSIIESEGTACHVLHLAKRDELPEVVAEYFSIPPGIVHEAISELGEFGDAWN
jgi:N-hydroxyarylamine O-acetyltransferase